MQYQYQLELRENGDEVGLLFTKWINLGPGISPDDPRWRIQTVDFDRTSAPRPGPIYDPEYMVLSPRSVFASLNATFSAIFLTSKIGDMRM